MFSTLFSSTNHSQSSSKGKAHFYADTSENKMFSYGTPAAVISTPLATQESENRRIAEFTFPASKQRERKSKVRSVRTSSSLIAPTGSPNSIVSLSEFPMPPTTLPYTTSKRRRNLQRVPSISGSVKPLHIVKRSPKIVPQTSPDTSLAASVIPLSDDDENICVANVLSELKACERGSSFKERQQTCDNQNVTPIIPADREASSTRAVQPEPPIPVSSSHEDAQMSDIIPVAGTTASPPYSTLGSSSDFTSLWEANKENIDPNGIIVWPRSLVGSNKPTNPLPSATNENMLFHGPIRAHNSCPLIPEFAPVGPPSSSLTRISSLKPAKARRKAHKVSLPMNSTCRKNLASPGTKARHRGNVILENYIYPPESSRTTSPSLSPSSSSYSYPDFSSSQFDTSRRSQSMFGDMTLVGTDTDTATKLITLSSALSCVSMHTESSGDQWYDVLSLTAYMEA